MGNFSCVAICVIRQRSLWRPHWNVHISFQSCFNEPVLCLCVSGEHPLQQKSNVELVKAQVRAVSYKIEA